MEKIRVGAVSYLNTKPLLYGVSRGDISKKIELITDYPANIAARLIEGSIDVGLVPVAIIPKLREFQIITDYCIGAEGPVASVGIFSEQPLETVKNVLLDYQSKTSVNLARVLLKHYWKLNVNFLDATEGYQSQIKKDTAGVVIGDRAFSQRIVSPYIYDLAEAWLSFTGLPFVFAAWVANRQLPAAFIEEFNEANAYGLGRLDEVIAENRCENYDLRTYYTKNINYSFNESKLLGLETFLTYLKDVSQSPIL